MEGINAIDVNKELGYCITELHSIVETEDDSEKKMTALDMIKDMILLQASLNAKAYELRHPMRMFMPGNDEEE